MAFDKVRPEQIFFCEEAQKSSCLNIKSLPKSSLRNYYQCSNPPTPKMSLANTHFRDIIAFTATLEFRYR